MLTLLLACATPMPTALYALPPPVLPVEPAGFRALMALSQSVEDNDLRAEIRAAWRSEEPTSWNITLLLEPVAPLLTLSGVQAPIMRMDTPAPDYAPLLTYAQYSTLVSRVALAAGEPNRATQSLLHALHLSKLLRYAGGVLPEAVGLAMERVILEELQLILTTGPGLSRQDEAKLASALAALHALPPASPHAIATDCSFSEDAFTDPAMVADGGVFYDPGLTVEMHRALCSRAVEQAGLPADQRTPLDLAEYIDEHNRWSNRAGASLLNIASVDYSLFVAQEEQLYSERAVVLSALLLRQGWDQGWQDTALPMDPRSGAPVLWESGSLSWSAGDLGATPMRPAAPSWPTD